ncbi:MAG: zf-HC2 domain-containing protein [Corynebacterium sp.]|nr:zf-HC2 domain-containing protein [Corynebacterium sp.]
MQQPSHRFLKHNQGREELSSRHQDFIEKAKATARKLDSIGHLGPEAIVAFVDGEMDTKAAHRVRVHLVHCAECRNEILKQRGTAAWVRENDGSIHMRASQDLVERLTSIANAENARVSMQCGEAEELEYEQSPETFLHKLELVLRAIKHNPDRK